MEEQSAKNVAVSMESSPMSNIVNDLSRSSLSDSGGSAKQRYSQSSRADSRSSEDRRTGGFPVPAFRFNANHFEMSGMSISFLIQL